MFVGWQAQSHYRFDYAVHSVMPVSEVIAKANLKPVPGDIEYVAGCPDCFYKLHTIEASDGTQTKQWFR